MNKLQMFAAGLLLVPASLAASPKSYVEPVDTSTVDTSGWVDFKEPVRFTWASKNVHYRQFATPPACNTADTTVSAWRGERIGFEALLISNVATGPVRLELSALERDGRDYADPGSSASFMRYVISTSWNACGYPPDTLPTFTVPDMIDLPEATVALQPRSVRPVWCAVEIPRDLAPGDYRLTLTAVDTASGRRLGQLGATVRVNRHTLPEGKDFAFYLDMWQQPYSVSRYYGVKPWSDEHFRLLEPYMRRLARAGQKTASVILFYEPWGEQSNDKFEPMIETTLTRDGKWKFDYAVFDKWVDFMDRMGINANISCFTMVPWEMKFRYVDQKTGKYEFLEAKTDSPEYRRLWTDFLTDFASHLRKRGLFDKTMIAMDERGLNEMLNAYSVAKSAVPDIKMSLAGSYHKELIDSLDSYTLIKGDFFPADDMQRRRDRGFITLMYTCCATPAPSQFSNSAPADGAYIPVYATATGHDGYLHWSYMNWTDNPLEDTRFHMFAPGDTYFIYPDNRSSVRYERMLEGVQMSEKLRLLRQEIVERNDIQALQRLDNALLPIRSGALNAWYPTSTVVDDLQRAIDELSGR